MPLPKPSLDNRRFDQLVAEGLAQIPRLAPRWTDHNASDPGVTLIELGAWLAEQNIYRFDRVSVPALRAFARLVGVEPRPPSVAETVVGIDDPSATGIHLPARTQLGDGSGAPHFETVAALDVSPARLVRLVAGMPGRLTDISEWRSADKPFAAFGPKPRPGSALYFGFDRPLGNVGRKFALHVWSATWPGDAAVRAALEIEPGGAGGGWRRHYRVRTIWEFHAGGGIWLPLDAVEDETRALSLSGFVRFSIPAGLQAGGAGSEYFVRCRIVAGRFECPPQLIGIAGNAVACEHALTQSEREIGRARGHAATTFPLGVAPTVAGSVQLRLDDGGGQVDGSWREAPDFERAGAFDKVFVLRPEAGEIACGDGLRGAVFPADQRLFASCRRGGGSEGNIEGGTLTAVPANAANVALQPALSALAKPLEVTQRFAATGGASRELPNATLARAFDVWGAVDKAVTLADIERLALATPGVPVARVRAVAGLDTRLPCVSVPGAVSLIVIPACGHPAPLPSRAMLDAVLAYLEPRRLVTSEIHALAPRYRRVGVAATLHLACAAADEVLAQATARLNDYLDPLAGGPDGKGWPFGRTVYRSEMMAMLAAIPGVDRVTDFGFVVPASCGGDCGCGGSGLCDNVELCANELVLPGRHRLCVDSTQARQLKRSDPHECQPV